ncbi:MAG TPA: galactokinase, partial [Burkholderiaceae bacterium]|nr:galactokinase [Burkholderiaceae bacterium]
MTTIGSTTGFEAVFGRAPEATADAPGRVNLLGEHTDYNDGFVLPTAIPQHTTVAVARGPGPGFRLHAAEYGETVEFDLARPPSQHHAQYVYGCLRELADDGAVLPPIDLHVHSTVPIGVGLSSSAALEVATLRALRALLGLAIDDVAIAQLAQRAEIAHAGVQCGIMDQMACSLAGEGSMLFLDTRSLERSVKPLPQGASILVLDSGVPRSLAESGYNARRDECREAARRLGVPSLREAVDRAAIEALPEPLRGRARHVVTENARVLEAAAGVDARRFGELMDASHASLRDDYEVSIPALDALVGLLQAHPDVFGARLTGAGFGGACVALCVPGRETAVASAVLAAYAAQGGRGAQRVPEPP